MRLVVEVPDETLKRFKAIVANEKRTQADVIREAIHEYIDGHKGTRPRKGLGDGD